MQISLKYDPGSAFHGEPGDEETQKQRADKGIIMLRNNTHIIKHTTQVLILRPLDCLWDLFYNFIVSKIKPQTEDQVYS